MPATVAHALLPPIPLAGGRPNLLRPPPRTHTHTHAMPAPTPTPTFPAVDAFFDDCGSPGAAETEAAVAAFVARHSDAIGECGLCV